MKADADESRKSIIDQLSHIQITNLEATADKIVKGFENLTIYQSATTDTILLKLDALSTSMSRLRQEMELTQTRLDILRSIRFDRLPYRFEQVSEAHEKTFQWAFEDGIQVPGKSDVIPLHFKDWLRDGEANTTFWVRGKAGSGKSTLMKFICSDERTARHLLCWAGDGRKLVIAKYFFWNAGASLQKSREGLLRTLLFDILQQCPDHLDVVERKLAGQRSKGPVVDKFWTWSWRLLTETFREVLQETAATAKICFIIDGLDEYESDPETIIATVNELASYSNTKVCISSRPWAEFILEYGEGEYRNILKVEDLTAKDIHTYTHENLMANGRFKRLADQDKSVQKLLSEVVQKSQGVFLWVFLVVRSLLEGMKYADSIQFLWKRLRGFPSDLDDFFDQMLRGVPEIYRSKAVSTFKVAMAASTPLPAMTYYWIEEVGQDEMFAVEGEWKAIPEHETNDHILDTTLRLDGWTKGLLEVVHHRQNKPDYDYSMVYFIHRTVRDFIKQSENVRRMFKTYDTPSLHIDTVICHASLASLKFRSEKPEGNEEPVGGYSRLIFYHASLIPDDLWGRHSIGAVIAQIRQTRGDASPDAQIRDYERITEYAAECGLKDYIQGTSYHRSPNTRPSGFYTVMLQRALVTSYDIESEGQISRLTWRRKRELVLFLLENGADPNRPSLRNPQVRSMWDDFVEEFDKVIKDEDPDALEICKAMILAGARGNKLRNFSVPCLASAEAGQ